MSARSGIVACVLLLLLHGVAAAGTPPRGPDELWREFPLDPAVTTPIPPAPASRPETEQQPAAPSPVAAAEPISGPSGNWWPLALAGIAGSLLVMSAGTAVIRSRAREPAPVTQRQPTPDELIAQARALEIEANEYDIMLRERRGRVIQMSRRREQDLPATDAALDTTALSSYSEIGERVASVFSAAEAAADEIRADARREADEILRVVNVDADTVRASAGAYEAEVHAAVDADATERRRDAEQQVRQQLADAEEQVRATREAAEEMAVQIEAAAQQRQLALQEESRSVAEGLQRALQELRRMTVQLEALVGTPTIRSGDESLVEALMPYTAAGKNDA